jgi:FkbM family methyltransferase
MSWVRRLFGRVASGERATEADIHYAYRLILRRPPDPAGLEHHRRRVRAGLLLPEMINDFLRSDEFHDRMEADRLGELRRVDLGGYELLVPAGDPDFGAIIDSYRTYEEPVRQVLRDHLRPGDVCLDVGANIGVMTFLASSIVGTDGLVVAVETNPENVQVLYRTIHMIGASNVMVLPVAASDRRSVFSLTGRSNTHLIAARAAMSGGGHFVQSVPLDDLLAGLPRLDFVKMDIEGHEPPALRGMARLLATHRPGLLVEFNPECLAVQEQDPHAFLQLIFAVHPHVRAVSHFGDDRMFAGAEDLMAYWTSRAAHLASDGTLGEGSLHFDLVAARG